VILWWFLFVFATRLMFLCGWVAAENLGFYLSIGSRLMVWFFCFFFAGIRGFVSVY